MQNLIFFNRIPLIDKFIINLISEKVFVTVARSVVELENVLACCPQDVVLLNVDDHLRHCDQIVSISKLSSRHIKVVVFGQYKEHMADLKVAGADIFLPYDAADQDFADAIT